MATYNFQQIASAWIVKNNPDEVRRVLIEKGIVSSGTSQMSPTILTAVLYQYYLKNGGAAFGALLSQMIPNENVSRSEVLLLQQSINEITSAYPNLRVSTPVVTNTLSTASVAQSTTSVVKEWWNLIVGVTTTDVAPTVTTVTKSSPITIALIIGGIAVLAILAWVIIKFR